MRFLKSIYQKVINAFKQGLSPKELALSISVGIIISIFPIFGITTIVLTGIAVYFKLNLPIMIILSYIFEPVKILLIIPFINIGARIFNTEHTLLSLEAIEASYKISFIKTVVSLWYEVVCGFAGWFVFAVPLSIPFFFLLKWVLSLFIKPQIKAQQ